MLNVQAIDAGDERRPDFSDSDDRGIPQVGRRKPPSRIWYVIVVGVMIVLIAALASMAALAKLKDRGKGGAEVQTDSVTAPTGRMDLTPEAFATNDVPPPLPEQAVPPPVSSLAPVPEQRAQYREPKLSPAQQAALDLAERRKRAPLVAVGQGMGGAETRSAVEEGRAGNGHGPLAQSLTATRMGGVSATMLADPNMTITQGRLLSCSLETAINSAVAGMTSCILTRDVYSTNGRVLLLERGSRLVGQYQSGQMRRGQNRIFVLWTRAETPHGVLVHLDSPATDSLGRSGLDGKLNRHFFERFGSALLVSVVDDLAEYQVARRQAEAGGDTLVLGGTSGSARDAASIIVENSINIPPTLDRAQGSSVGIFVARDLYFGDVYALAPRNRAG